MTMSYYETPTQYHRTAGDIIMGANTQDYNYQPPTQYYYYQSAPQMYWY